MDKLNGMIKVKSTFINPEAISLIFYDEGHDDLNIYLQGYGEDNGKVVAQSLGGAEEYEKFLKNFEAAMKQRCGGK